VQAVRQVQVGLDQMVQIRYLILLQQQQVVVGVEGLVIQE
jgi:hypothetical protein